MIHELENNIINFSPDCLFITIEFNPHRIRQKTVKDYLNSLDYYGNKLKFVSQKEKEKAISKNQMYMMSLISSKDYSKSVDLVASSLVELLSSFLPSTMTKDHIEQFEKNLSTFIDSQKGSYRIGGGPDGKTNAQAWDFFAPEPNTLPSYFIEASSLKELLMNVLPEWGSLVEKEELESQIVNPLKINRSKI
jgi:hypothetical protein